MHEALARAWSLHQAGEREAAERAYRELLEREPGLGDALNCYGILLMQTGRADQALAHFLRAAASEPKQAPFRLNVARAALRVGRPELALEAADAALELASGANAWLLRGVALRDLDRADEARAAFRKGAQKHPDDLALQFNLAVGELDAGNAKGAVAQFEKLLQARPNEARAWLGLGNAQAALGALETAEGAYRRAVASAPDLSEAWRLLGLTLLQRGQPRPAVEALRRGLQRDPRDQAALAALAVAATLAQDPVACLLLDFDATIRTAALPAAFDHPALAAEILAHPSLRYDRGQKTTRDGGQTGNLIDAATPQLARFVAALREEVALRIAQAASSYAAARHPLAHTAPARWQLNLWATVLNRQGRQAAHLHPSGWMSGVYYVALPDVEATRQDGWIEFGLPPEELAPEIGLPRRRVQPRVGELTTFPSYLYHRTVPHAGTAPRISLAFDVVPLA
jgi:Tfp pilus assembly protein PilF